MTDYVSKEELRKFFEGIEITVGRRTSAEAISEVLKAVYYGVMELPTTDAVPVIRCKECKHRPQLKEEVRPYDHVWDMYLDEFEDDKDVSAGDDDCCPVYYEMLNEIQHLRDKCRNYERTIHKLSVALVERTERREE